LPSEQIPGVASEEAAAGASEDHAAPDSESKVVSSRTSEEEAASTSVAPRSRHFLGPLLERARMRAQQSGESPQATSQVSSQAQKMPLSGSHADLEEAKEVAADESQSQRNTATAEDVNVAECISHAASMLPSSPPGSISSCSSSHGADASEEERGEEKPTTKRRRKRRGHKALGRQDH